MDELAQTQYINNLLCTASVTSQQHSTMASEHEMKSCIPAFQLLFLQHSENQEF